MAIHYLSRPNPLRAVNGIQPPSHASSNPGEISGVLELKVRTIARRGVSPSTGKFSLEGDGQLPVLACARRAGVPVIPGTGIKGAIRTYFEMLTRACVLFSEGNRPTCKSSKACPACALFGCLGLQGRISFSDAVPVAEDAVEVTIAKVFPAWEPKGRPGGEFRIYDHFPAIGDPHRPAPEKIGREVYLGTFRTRLWFRNLEPGEFGRLLAAMGLSPDLSSRFFPRLGGAKYDGFGAVEVKPHGLRLMPPQRQTLEGQACRAKCREWLSAAFDSDWATVAAPILTALAQYHGGDTP